MIWCIDLDNTITSTPDLMQALMRGLREEGNEVHILSGCHEDVVTPEVAAKKTAELRQLGFAQGQDYDVAVAVSGPEKEIPEGKVSYMRHVGASALVDNDKKNIKAARKAGFLGLRHYNPKGTDGETAH